MEDIKKIQEIINHPKLSDDYKFNVIKDIIFFKNYKKNVKSSNVDIVSYNDDLKEMVIRFNNGQTYTYYNVDRIDQMYFYKLYNFTLTKE